MKKDVWIEIILVALLIGLAVIAYNAKDRVHTGGTECKPYCTVAFV